MKYGRWFLSAFAALLLLLLGLWIGSRFFGRPGYMRQGSLVWIDGRSYVEAAGTLREIERRMRAELTRSLPAASDAIEPPRVPRTAYMVAAAAEKDRSKFHDQKAAPKSAYAGRPHDWIFLVECCGAQSPQTARHEIELVERLMSFAAKDSMAGLVVAGARPGILAPYRLDATPETKQRMVELLEHAHLVGGLNLEAAIDAAMPLLAAAKDPVLVHIGTGRPTLGQRDPQTLRGKLPPGVRYVGIGVPPREPLKIDPDAEIAALFNSLNHGEPPANLFAHPVAPERAELAGSLLQALCASILPPPRFPSEIRGVQEWRELGLAAADWHAGHLADADRRLGELLLVPGAARSPLLWRMAAVVADAQGRYYRAIECWERALNVSGTGCPLAGGVPLAGGTRSVPDTFVPDTLAPNDYRWLLNEYGKVATATAGMNSAARSDLVARVATVADHWRLLDPGSSAPCITAARILTDLGATEEAWLYATTASATVYARASQMRND